jgi:hypothetical protein
VRVSPSRKASRAPSESSTAGVQVREINSRATRVNLVIVRDFVSTVVRMREAEARRVSIHPSIPLVPLLPSVSFTSHFTAPSHSHLVHALVPPESDSSSHRSHLVLPPDPASSSTVPCVHTNDTMDDNERWRQLESRIPAEQLLPSVAFSVCCPSSERASHLDQLQGEHFVASLLHALWVQSKARTILECWCILMMRSRLQDERKKDELYDLLLSGSPPQISSVQLQVHTVDEKEAEQGLDEGTDSNTTGTTLVPIRPRSKAQQEAEKKQKTRWKRGVVVLAHLLIDRAQHGSPSLLDAYLDQVFFPWSVATEQKLGFLLSPEVIKWIEAARTYFAQKRNKIDRKQWLELSPGVLGPSAVVGREQKEEGDNEVHGEARNTEQMEDTGEERKSHCDEQKDDDDEEHKQINGSSPVQSEATVSSSSSTSVEDAPPTSESSPTNVTQRRTSSRISTPLQVVQTRSTHHADLMSKPRKRGRSARSSPARSTHRQRRQRHDRDGTSEDDHGVEEDDQDSDSDEDKHDDGEQRWRQREAALMAVFVAWSKTIKERLLQAILIEQVDQLESVKAIAMELDAPPIGLVGGRRDEEEKSSEPAGVDGESKDWMSRGWVEVYEEAAVAGQGVRALRDIAMPSSTRSPAAVAVNLHQAGDEFVRLRSDELEKDPTYLIPLDLEHWFDAREHWVGRINHLPTPHCNLKLIKSGKIVQLRSIIGGEALSFDYGRDYWVYRVTGLELDEWLAGDDAEGRQSRSQLFTTMHKKVSDYTPLLALRSLTKSSTMMEKQELLEALSKALDNMSKE